MRSFNGNSSSFTIPPEHVLRSTTVGKGAPARTGVDETGHAVLMAIRVDTGQLADVRRVLQKLLGPNLDIYTAVIDNKNGRACLQLELAAERVPEAMSLIMRTLPEAEFGSIRRSPRVSTH
jgi:hypothetical protein